MKILCISLVFCAVMYSFVHACQVPETIEFRKATPSDAAGIEELINAHGVHDNDKIVILPKLFRLMAVKKNIEDGRYYVAYDHKTQQVVGFKKVFVIDDPEDHEKIAHTELRYAGDRSELVDTSLFLYHDEQAVKQPSGAVTQDRFDDTVLYIYTGGDFTHPSTEYRGKGINTKLSATAFQDLTDQIRMRLQSTKLKAIACVYGLTHSNDYADNGSGKSRTPGLARLFGQFISGLMSVHTAVRVYHRRFRSCMPTFAPDALECVPLPDDQAVKGYGNVLYYMLADSLQNNS